MASGILLLAQDGGIELDAPLRQYVEDVPASCSKITIRQLLTHTSGIVREAPGFDPDTLNR
jgi:CubicO group peptidase (beta-lactamase class C family)